MKFSSFGFNVSEYVYIYQSLATSIICIPLNSLNILTSPSMCKQEDYFSKKLIYMHNRKIYISIFQCHASTGRPKPCKSFGTRDNGGSRLWAEPRVASRGPPSQKHTVKKKKSFLNVARKHFYPPLKFGIMSACWYLVVEEEEKKKQSWRRRSQLLKCALSKERCLSRSALVGLIWSRDEASLPLQRRDGQTTTPSSDCRWHFALQIVTQVVGCKINSLNQELNHGPVLTAAKKQKQVIYI